MERVTELQLEDEFSDNGPNPAEEPTLIDTFPDHAPNVFPLAEERVSNVFCCAALADANTGTFYTDMSGKFPVMSLEGMQAYFIAYDYDINCIFAILVKDFTNETIVEAFGTVFNGLKSKGFTPQLNVTDNQATRPIKEYLKKEHCK